MPEFHDIAAMARKVVVDSAGMPDATRRPPAGRRTSRARGVLLGDLSWTRLTRWREMLSQVFENRRNLARLDHISSVRVTFGGAYEVAAWYLGAWVAECSRGCRRQRPVERHRRPRRPVPAREARGRGLSVELARSDDRLGITVNDLSQRHQPAAAHRLPADARRARHRASRPGFRPHPGIRRPSRVSYGANECPLVYLARCVRGRRSLRASHRQASWRKCFPARSSPPWRSRAGRRPGCCSRSWPNRKSAGTTCTCSGWTSAVFRPPILPAITSWPTII